MSYRDSPPQRGSAELAELDAYEAQLRRSARRKKIVMWSVFGVMLTVGLGSCFGPLTIAIGQEAWRTRTVKLTRAEQNEVEDALAPLEANAKKSQVAFEALWPKIRNREIGAREDLGHCTVRVPGPDLEERDETRSLEDSAGASGWTFIDVTPKDARSPLATLNMPRGSLNLNNSGTGERFVMPAARLNIAPGDKAPTLASNSVLEDASRLREQGKTLHSDGHEEYLRRVHALADEGLGIDVIVFVDRWEDPKMTTEMAPTPDHDPDDFAHPTPRPARLFESGFAVAHAIAWDPDHQKIACAAQALGMSSEHITFRSDQLEPLQQDLVLELEHALQRSFVAVGDAPPALETPSPTPSATPTPTPTPSGQVTGTSRSGNPNSNGNSSSGAQGTNSRH